MSIPIVQATKDDDIREAMLTVAGLDEAGAIFLIVAPFEATKTTVLGDLVNASFPGAADLPSGVPTLIKDSVSGKWGYYFPEPEGGWVWTRTAGAGDPQTVYGFKIDGFGCALIPPCVIAVAGDSCIIGDIFLPFDDLVADVGS